MMTKCAKCDRWFRTGDPHVCLTSICDDGCEERIMNSQPGKVIPACEKFMEAKVEGEFITEDSGERQEGIKHDTEKPPMALLSSVALFEVAKVLNFGQTKYTAWNWSKGFDWSRPASAALRHIFQWLAGEDKDQETGLSHLAHAMCEIMFVLDFEINKIGTDDRRGK